MLHPAGTGINLAERHLGSGDDFCIFIENDGSRTGGSLVESDDIISHDKFLSVVVVSIIHEIYGNCRGISREKGGKRVKKQMHRGGIVDKLRDA